MTIISEVKHLLHKDEWILFLNHFKIANHIDDKRYLQMLYKAKTGETLNLDNPRTFSEKLQWLKLYNRNPLYTIMVDKVAVKEYVTKILGKDCIIPTLGEWDTPEAIDFDILPNKFVLKCNHNSGLGMVICTDKSTLNISETRKKLKKGIREDFYSHAREWPYKNVRRKILAEQYMENTNGEELKDYKFFCFNGIPEFCQVISNRFSGETIDFFDMKWNIQEFTGLELPYKPHSQNNFKPKSLETMIEYAKKLSRNIPFVRVDFYEINGQIYFGELTFFPASGLGKFEPEKWNLELGKLIKLDGIEYKERQ